MPKPNKPQQSPKKAKKLREATDADKRRFLRKHPALANFYKKQCDQLVPAEEGGGSA